VMPVQLKSAVRSFVVQKMGKFITLIPADK